jgi:hypothetical protein
MIASASDAGIRLKRSDVDKAIDDDRHYFLVKDCVEAVPIPVDAG